MNCTKEKILKTALKLFSEQGYEAVSVSQIAGELCITKGALYKHFKNKRDIFESIVKRMAQRDAENAVSFSLPEGTLSECKEKYRNATVKNIIDFSMAQFKYWTEDEFASLFRKILILEQYRDIEMAELYQNYLVAGPVGYVSDLFRSIGVIDPERKALELYGPMFLFYGIYDGDPDLAKKSANKFFKEIANEIHIK